MLRAGYRAEIICRLARLRDHRAPAYAAGSRSLPNDVPTDVPASKPTRHYRKFTPPSTLTSEQVRRQTEVLRAACEHLVSGAAIAFLNAYNKELGGNPLQIALESDDGLLRVEQHLAGAGRGGRPDPESAV